MTFVEGLLDISQSRYIDDEWGFDPLWDNHSLYGIWLYLPAVSKDFYHFEEVV